MSVAPGMMQQMLARFQQASPQIAQMGAGMASQGLQQGQQQDQMLDLLARQGPPPSVPQQGNSTVGANLTQPYQQTMAPPGLNLNAPPKTRGEAMTNPSIGQLLGGGV